MLAVVDVVGTNPTDFKVSIPRELFQGLTDITPHSFVATELGKRFLVVSPTDILARSNSPIVLTVNWTSGLGLMR